MKQLMPYSIRVTFEENKTIEVSGDDQKEVRRLVNNVTEKFFPNSPWIENNL
jgi:hypothetical protein